MYRYSIRNEYFVDFEMIEYQLFTTAPFIIIALFSEIAQEEHTFYTGNDGRKQPKMSQKLVRLVTIRLGNGDKQVVSRAEICRQVIVLGLPPRPRATVPAGEPFFFDRVGQLSG